MANTIFLLTAKLVEYPLAVVDNAQLESRIERLLSSGALQEEVLGNSPSLDQLRKACLLSFYEFHQFPGQQAWMRIGKLVRIAYWIGLDRFDTRRQIFLGRDAMSQDEADNWRRLWWCIYRLDSYANLAAGTPYMVDEGSIHTALIQDAASSAELQDQHMASLTLLFLPPRLSYLKDLIPSIVCQSEQTADFNLHLLTVTLMRQIGRGLRQNILSRGEITNPSTADLENQLSVLRLALPTHYLNPMRNALQGETHLMHHARLVDIFHLHMSKLLIAISNCGHVAHGDDEWFLGWQYILETSQDIASAAAQWNPTYSLHVDPAICFIIFTALIFVHLHTKTSTASLHQISSIECHESVLLLQLEQFARTWTLSKLLICKFICTFRWRWISLKLTSISQCHLKE
jgi:hypothetical protein